MWNCAVRVTIFSSGSKLQPIYGATCSYSIHPFLCTVDAVKYKCIPGGLVTGVGETPTKKNNTLYSHTFAAVKLLL